MKATVMPLICWYPSWKTRIIKSLLREANGDFIDVGANIGQSLCSYVYAGVDCGYWGIEPNEECVAILNQIIEYNKIANCMILGIGLSNVKTAGQLFVQPGFATDTRATIRPEIRPNRKYKIKEVPLLPFDLIREKHHISKVGLVKIDAEGAELQVLRGMATVLNADRPPILCEVLLRDKFAEKNRYRAWSVELMNLLSESNYDVHRAKRTGPQPNVSAFPVTEFPLQVWTQFRRGQCDYVFLPREHAARYRGALLVSPNAHPPTDD